MSESLDSGLPDVGKEFREVYNLLTPMWLGSLLPFRLNKVGKDSERNTVKFNKGPQAKTIRVVDILGDKHTCQ